MSKIQNHVNHSKLTFSCGAGSANINVFTGRLLFESPDISIGVNSYEIGLSHIYDSQPDFSFNESIGNGWKLNVHQYIQKSYEKDANDQNLYSYIDSYGYVHKFEKYDTVNGEDKYFDRTGLGLTLYINSSSSSCYIEDSQYGKMYFEDFGEVKRLVKTVSGLNSKIVQHITYTTDGKIESVYDERKSNRKFEFTYNETNQLLKKIKCGANHSSVEYTYDGNNNLISVRKTVNSTIRYNITYSYKNNLLKYAVYIQDNTSLRFLYDEKGRVYSVSDGVKKTQFKFSEPTPALFASDSIYSGISSCGVQERKFLGYTITDSDADFDQGENSSGLNFSSSKTTIRNGKGVQTTYFFNQNGFTTAILEKAGSGKYKTLFKQTGICVSNQGKGESINANKSTCCKSRYDFISDKRKEADEFFKKDINKKNYDYVMSFWVKLNSDQTEKVKARLCLKYRYANVDNTSNGIYLRNFRTVEEYTSSSLLDCSAKGGWQYVTIPFSFVKDKYIGSSLYKTFYEICHIDLDGAVGNFDIADIRITPGKVPVFTLTNGNEDDSTLTMEYVETINYTLSDGTSGGGEITKDYFMTDSDITSTYMELIKARASGNSQAPYTLICNAGTKRVANVIDTQIIGNGVNVSLGYAAVQDEYYKGKTFYVPNYKTASEPSSGDNRTYTTTAYNIVSGKVKVIRQHTHVIKYPDTAADFMQVISDEYTWQDLFGATLQKRDAYGVTTENIFDEYNNLTQTKVSHSDTSEVILEKYVYSSDGEVLLSTKDIILNENNEEETFNEINYETDPLYGTLKSSQQAATSELTANTNNYTYNDFRDKLKQVELKVSGVPYGKNTLKYDENGRLCEASPSENCVYGFKYDKFGKAVEFSLNGVILLTKDYDYDKNSVSASYYRSETEIDILKTKYDKYGRIKKLYRGKPTERAKSRRRKR